MTEQERQKSACEILASHFPVWSFVGFYDFREPDGDKFKPDTIYIGEYVSESIFPCGEIKLGKGQCGLCAEKKETLITYNTKECDNYIACDADTQSEIVVPCFGPDGSVKSVFDLDSPELGTFDETDNEWLEKIMKMVYP